MSNLLEYTLKLNDNVSGVMSKIGSSISKLKFGLDQVSSAATGMGNILKKVGIDFSVFNISNMMQEGVEKVHALHEASAQLANTMKNMGTYSESAYEKAIKGAENMSKGLKYAPAEIIALQSQLRMVGNIGENEMNRLTMASADMATKFGMGLNEAGNEIAKAVNNPEMMRRLAMTLKIDPDIADNIQKIAKAGKEAQARLMLMDIVEQKVGGAAIAAFNADPLSRFNKAVEGIQIKLGELSIKIQSKLAPVLEILGALTTKVIDKISESFGWFFGKLKEGDPIIMGITLVVGALTSAIITVTTATKLWAAAQWLVSISNPAVLIIAGIVALIAVIAYLIYKIDGWGEAWNHTINGAKLIFQSYVEYVKSSFNTVISGIMIGINKIMEGWYKFKIAVGIGNKSENQKILSQIQADTEDRKKSIVDGWKKTADLAIQSGQEFKNAAGSFSWNNKSLSDVTSGLKNKLGIAAPVVPGTDGKGVAGTGGLSAGGTGKAGKGTADSIATGGTKSTNITIHLGSLIAGGFTIAANDIKEGASKMRDVVLDEMTRVLTMAQATAM